MRKYFIIFKSELMTNIQYIWNNIINFISYAIIIYIYMNLWKYMYQDSNELINGYSMNQMIWYVAYTEIIWMSLGGRAICKDISNDVKSGGVAYKINRPYSYISYWLSAHLVKISIKFLVYLVLGILLGFVLLGSLPSLSLISILMVLISTVLAIVISIFLISAIGLLSFYIEDANPLYWIYSKIILVIGTLFPIEYFPSFLQPIIRYSPIYVVSYGPAKLFVDFSYSTCIEVLLTQILYVGISYLLCLFLYKKGEKKLNVNGG